MESLQAAEQLATEGIEIEVIDVATIKPLDMETIKTSVAKTGRCLIVHEAARSLNGRDCRRTSRKLLAGFTGTCGGSAVMTLSCHFTAMSNSTCQA